MVPLAETWPTPDPASDLPAVVLAFDAELVATGPAGQRSIPASSFFQGLMMTSLGDDEILTSVRVPSAGAGSGSSYAKCENPASRYAIVGVSAVVSVSDGVCSSARIGVTGAGSVAVRASAGRRRTGPGSTQQSRRCDDRRRR